METNKLKKFAADARISLMDGVRRKLRLLGFDEKGRVIGKEPQLMDGGTLWNEEEYPESFYQQWTALRDRLQERGVREVVEEAAYTWFNRMMAIRILTMNGLCEPIFRFDPATGLPLLLADARMGRVPEMSAQERSRFDKLMDDDHRPYDQFALLLTVWCHDNPIIRSCFGSIHDYVELLLPDNILRPDGFLAKLNDTPFISEEDYKSAELIGWLYQFYISDRKDEVFAKKGKVEAEEIPAATQIFTPNWIVKYMVENTILPQVDADDEILENAKYLVGTHGSCVREQKVDLEDLKVADFACGSGHILNECFDLLFALYRAESYSRREAIECIFTKNLTGIDIDLRAKQLATFALLLKACQQDASFADAHCMPHVITVPEMTSILKTSKYEDEDGGHGKAIKYDFFQNSVTHEIAVELENALTLIKDADSLGSIIKFDLSSAALRAIKETAEYWQGKDAIERPEFVNDLLPAIDFILTLSDSYDAIVMNPPYMGGRRFNEVVSLYVAGNGKKGKSEIIGQYPNSKADLFSIFMEVCGDRLKEGGKYGMINMQSWMFISSFVELRDYILNNYHIDNMLHLGVNTFDSGVGTIVKNTAFIITKEQNNQDGIYYDLTSEGNGYAKEIAFLKRKNEYIVNQDIFKDMPDRNLAYWASPKVIDFIKKSNFNSFTATQGMATCDNDRFVRNWHEVELRKIFFSCPNLEEASSSNLKWFPYNKGGEKRRWYGNQSFVVNWENDGEEVKNYATILYKTASRTIKNTNFYFRPSISWTDITEGSNAYRIYPEGFIFDVTGMSCFVTGNLYNFLGVLNTKFYTNLVYIINPTLHFQVGDFRKYPFRDIDDLNFEDVVEACISISKQDWDAHETSWDFQTNPLVLSCYDMGGGKLEDSVADYEQVWEQKFRKLHANEEELNRQFIEIYGLQDELTPDVPLDEITILQQGEVKIESGELKWQRNVIIQQLISYIVGCYMGRYRLDRVDEKGLHIAHPEPSEVELAPYKVSFTNDATFTIDSDGIIPVLPKGAPFYDNLYNYVEQFVKMVWGETHLQENMNFIEKCLGKPLNDYLMKDFWKYHKKMYQNRPIYWEFASKKGAFRALVYAHRMDRFTVEVLRSKYLLPYISYIEKKVANMESRAADLSTPERRELDALRDKTLPELREYADRVEVVALKNITFDLDDGIIKNHSLFGDIVTKLK